MQPKRILITLLVVILALCSAGTAVSAEDSSTLDMAVEVSSSTALSDNGLFIVDEGDVVTVSVTIKSNPGFSLASFALLYNASVLEPVMNGDALDWTKSELFGGADEIVTVKTNENEGKVKYTVHDGTKDHTATGLIFTCKFKVVGHGSSDLFFDMDGGDIANTALEFFDDDFVTSTINGVTADTLSIQVHEFETNSTHVDATCTVGGKNIYTCKTCKETVTVDDAADPAKGHTEVKIPSVAPTCRTAGKTEGLQCSVCSLVIMPQYEVPAGDNYHVKVVDDAVAPTCLASGLTEGEHCSVCAKVFTEQTVVPQLTEHSYGDWVDNGDGTQTKTCSICNSAVTENIATNGGNPLVAVLIIVIVILALALIGGGVFLVIFLTKKKKVV